MQKGASTDIIYPSNVNVSSGTLHQCHYYPPECFLMETYTEIWKYYTPFSKQQLQNGRREFNVNNIKIRS